MVVLEFPVVLDAVATRLVFLEKTPFWGSAWYRKTRQEARLLLAPE